MKREGILFKEKIILSSIIPIEVGHNLFEKAEMEKELDKKSILDLLLSLISNENCKYHLFDSLWIMKSTP